MARSVYLYNRPRQNSSTGASATATSATTTTTSSTATVTGSSPRVGDSVMRMASDKGLAAPFDRCEDERRKLSSWLHHHHHHHHKGVRRYRYLHRIALLLLLPMLFLAFVVFHFALFDHPSSFHWRSFASISTVSVSHPNLTNSHLSSASASQSHADAQPQSPDTAAASGWSPSGGNSHGDDDDDVTLVEGDVEDESIHEFNQPPRPQAEAPVKRYSPADTESSMFVHSAGEESGSFQPPADYPHRCYLQTTSNESEPLDSFPFNSRAFCLTSSVCFRPSTPSSPSTLYHAAPLHQTTCVRTSADFQPLARQTNNCSYIQSLVHLAHGRYLSASDPVHPQVRPMSDLQPDEISSARWLDGLVFYVPAYPHLRNIYHFSFIPGAISHILAASSTLIRQWREESIHLPKPLPVTVVFRNAPLSVHGLWQEAVMDFIVKHRLKLAGIDVRYTTMNESVFGDVSGSLTPRYLTCSRSAILLGTRSDVNTWPFPTSVDVQKDGNSTPFESVAFRKAAYDAVGIHTLLPSLPHDAASSPPQTAMFDLPPRVIGYARRNYYPDPSPGQPRQVGTHRRFSDADDAWFASMLQDVAVSHNFSYAVLQPSEHTEMAEQVNMYSKVGYLAGIHGANLMNAIFMPPFSALFEVFANLKLQCYIAGANSGLKYSLYVPVREATAEESGCLPPHQCWTVQHMRRVMIGTDIDRTALRSIVEGGIARIRMLHKRFGAMGGIPVFYNATSTSYQIDWDRQTS